MRTKERLIQLFMFEPSGLNNDVYLLQYEHRKQQYKEDKPILNEMVADGLIKVVDKTSKTITFQYFPPKQGGGEHNFDIYNQGYNKYVHSSSPN